MSKEYYRPITPEFREDLNNSIMGEIEKLQSCQQTSFTEAYISGYTALYGLINILPNGFPLPLSE